MGFLLTFSPVLHLLCQIQASHFQTIQQDAAPGLNRCLNSWSQQSSIYRHPSISALGVLVVLEIFCHFTLSDSAIDQYYLSNSFVFSRSLRTVKPSASNCLRRRLGIAYKCGGAQPVLHALGRFIPAILQACFT